MKMEANHSLNYKAKRVASEIFNQMIYDIRIKNLFHMEYDNNRNINLFIINSQNIVLKKYLISLRIEDKNLYMIKIFEHDDQIKNMIYTNNSYEDIISTLLMISEII